eukprot:TRINITY_DN2724_c0_g1_i1.p1 TRINITY_DN2724_c0_g1~~TRINITY_DN2724_c0_g1_i1.p1  ORF type:complete len:359 (+),score=39.71 TRINITY_DN2724_c0_g1_i1:58-1077(+)
MEFNTERHRRFLKHMLNVLPTPYSSQDCNRLTLIYFVVGSLDLIDALTDEDKKRIIEYVYALQVLPDKDDSQKHIGNCGFRGGTFFGQPYDPKCNPTNIHEHDKSHIAMTYTALCVLTVCGDDLSRVCKKAVTGALPSLQEDDGSFSPVNGGNENDMRFIFCAAAISYMLNDFSGMNVDKTVEYIKASQSYDAGIAQGPGQESHGGSTYCAIAALRMLGRLDDLPNKEKLIQWCVERQISGFQGRINKPADSCYSFWIGATLTMLGAYEFVDVQSMKGFVMCCETKHGGFGKWPDTYPDVMHTYLSMCGMSLGGQEGLKPIEPSLGFSKVAASVLVGRR